MERSHIDKILEWCCWWWLRNEYLNSKEGRMNDAELAKEATDGGAVRGWFFLVAFSSIPGDGRGFLLFAARRISQAGSLMFFSAVCKSAYSNRKNNYSIWSQLCGKKRVYILEVFNSSISHWLGFKHVICSIFNQDRAQLDRQRMGFHRTNPRFLAPTPLTSNLSGEFQVSSPKERLCGLSHRQHRPKFKYGGQDREVSAKFR